MKPSLRLWLSVAMIVMSAIYAVTVVKNPQIASAIALGYVALLLTVFVLVNVWKKP
jgi:hypothetical protein